MVWEKIFDIIYKRTPTSDAFEELPALYKFIFSTLAQLSIFGTFIYLFYEGFTQSITQKFLSLQANAGICNQVFRVGSGVFKADSNGYWEGNTEFSYPSSVYQFSITKVQLSEQMWFDLIQENLGNAISRISMVSKKFNLAQNLIIWMAWTLSITIQGNNQLFQLTGDPNYVFDLQYHTSAEY